jgi:hypothetical protein
MRANVMVGRDETGRATPGYNVDRHFLTRIRAASGLLLLILPVAH